jgi:hypothetical protein
MIQSILLLLFKSTKTYVQMKCLYICSILSDETEFMNDTIFEIIDKTAQVPEHALIFNHASQAWNNDFFLRTLVKLNTKRNIIIYDD